MQRSVLSVQPLESTASVRSRVYDALKRAITSMDIYGQPEPIRLDERQLSRAFGVSRTPVREAISLLEREGFVYIPPRNRGIYVARKSKKQIFEMIVAWAALESMAARLATERATGDELRRLQLMLAEHDRTEREPDIDAYSEANVAFHQEIIRLGKCRLIQETTDSLFVHMRAIRLAAMRHDGRTATSKIGHRNIVAALVKRDREKASRLVREHALDLGNHVERYCDYLD